MQGLKNFLSNGRWQEAFTYYLRLRRSGVQLTDPSLFPAIVKACGQISFTHGESMHASSIRQGYDSFTSTGNSTLDFYMKWGAIGSALSVFRCMRCRDSVSWNIIVHGYLDHGDLEQGLRFFMQARVAGFEPNAGTLVLVSQAHRSLGDFVGGQKFHCLAMKAGFWAVVSLQNSLLELYCDFDMQSAHVLFDEMSERDVISWSLMVKNEEAALALELFQKMVSRVGFEPDGQIIVSVLKACADTGDYDMGRCIHGSVIYRGFECDVFAGNSLLDMYMKSCDVDCASAVFNEMPHRNNVSWNSMLSGFIHNGMHSDALTLFSNSMVHEEVSSCDEVTLVNLLQICKHFAVPMPYYCKSIHSKVLRSGFELNGFLLNSLMDAYAKCYLIELAKEIFSRLTRKDLVSWGVMIGGFSHCGLPHESIAVFREMIQAGVRPNVVIILNLVEACASSVELGRAKWAHSIAIRRGLAAEEVSVGTAIVDMYSKCGAIETSRKAFDQLHLHQKNIRSWSAMITAYGMNGQAHEALALLAEMKQHGIKPNAVTALSVLSACSHAGLVAEGLSFFRETIQDSGLEQYACVVDMLSRAGKLDIAMDLIETMPEYLKSCASASSLWGALLSSCSRSTGNTEIGVEAVSHVLELEPLNSAGYLLASSMHSARGAWGDAAKMRWLAKQRAVKVFAGQSWVYVDSREFRFAAGDGCTLQAGAGSSIVFVVEELHRCLRIVEVIGMVAV